MFGSFIRREYNSLTDYIINSRMKFVGSWATEVEIQAAANLLGLDIYTHTSGKWLKYKCMGRRVSEQGIYLLHHNENHYESVVCVKHHSGCYNLCTIQEQLNNKQMQTRSDGNSCIEMIDLSESEDSVADSGQWNVIKTKACC